MDDNEELLVDAAANADRIEFPPSAELGNAVARREKAAVPRTRGWRRGDVLLVNIDPMFYTLCAMRCSQERMCMK